MSLKGYDGYFLGTNCILPFSLLEGKNRGCSKFTFLTKIQLVQATKKLRHRKVSGFKHGYSGVSMLNFGGGGSQFFFQVRHCHPDMRGADKLLLFSEPGDQSLMGVPSLKLTYPLKINGWKFGRLNFLMTWSIFRGRSFMFGGVTSSVLAFVLSPQW